MFFLVWGVQSWRIGWDQKIFFGKMTKRKLALGKGARVSVLLKFLHPSADVRTNFPHRHPQDRLENAEVLRIEKKRITRKDQQAVVMRHQSFGDKEVYAVVRFCRVTSEGLDTFFPQAEEDDASSLEESGQKEHPQDILELQQKRGIFYLMILKLLVLLLKLMMTMSQLLRTFLVRQLNRCLVRSGWMFLSVTDVKQTSEMLHQV